MNYKINFNKIIIVTISIVLSCFANNFAYVNASEPSEKPNIFSPNLCEFEDVFTDNSISSNDIFYIESCEHSSEIVRENISEL